MKVYAVLAHPLKKSLNHHLFYATVEHLKKQGVTVDVLDLYEHVDQIPFYRPPSSPEWQGKGLDQFPMYREIEKSIMSADRLFIMYPVYAFNMPAILKAWIELISDYAYKTNPKSPKPIPLHRITKGLIVNTAGMPNVYRWFFTKNSATEAMKRSLNWIGIKSQAYEIGSADKLTAKKVEWHVAKIASLADSLIKG